MVWIEFKPLIMARVILEAGRAIARMMSVRIVGEPLLLVLVQAAPVIELPAA